MNKTALRKLIDQAKDALDRSDFEQAYQLYVHADDTLGEVADDDTLDFPKATTC